MWLMLLRKIRPARPRRCFWLGVQPALLLLLGVCGTFLFGTQGGYNIKSAHFDFLGPAQKTLEMPQPPQLTEHESKSLGLMDFSG